jgi:hypothetical protein
MGCGTCRLGLLAGAVVLAGCSLLRGREDGSRRAPGLVVPVAGVSAADIPDSFDAPRAGGRRRHHALDIFAPLGTPVLSADDGVVLLLRRNRLGGLGLYAADPHRRFVYYYAHLRGYHPDMAPGRRLRRGEVIGYVGATGNANPRRPHLHFQLRVYPSDDRWWTGTPLNPLHYFATPGRRAALGSGHEEPAAHAVREPGHAPSPVSPPASRCYGRGRWPCVSMR